VRVAFSRARCSRFSRRRSFAACLSAKTSSLPQCAVTLPGEQPRLEARAARPRERCLEAWSGSVAGSQLAAVDVVLDDAVLDRRDRRARHHHQPGRRLLAQPGAGAARETMLVAAALPRVSVASRRGCRISPAQPRGDPLQGVLTACEKHPKQISRREAALPAAPRTPSGDRAMSDESLKAVGSLPT
jgi:hypothetical protein